MIKLKNLMLCLVAVFMLVACSTNDLDKENISEEKFHIVTTISQIGEPLEVIGGDVIQVTSLMGPGVDPHLYVTTQSDINALQQADMIFYNGLNLEGNMGEVFENMKKSKITMAIGETIPESELLNDEDGAVDPHIWFNIDLWKKALQAAVEEMKKELPEHADVFEKNKDSYFQKLDDLKEEAMEKMEKIPAEQRVLVTAHDAFGYLGEMYDLEVVGLQGLSTEDEVGISDIQNTIDLLVERQIPAVFVESSVNQNSINAVIEGAEKAGLQVKLGGELFSDAMGKKGTEEGTYIGMYRHNINTIYEALQGGRQR